MRRSSTKSSYQNKEFADFWNRISGKYGQGYKRYLLDPILLRMIPPLKNKAILDLGCGNGYMARKFVRLGARRVLLLDISEHNLNHARRLLDGAKNKVQLIRQDATHKWKVASASLDVVFSDMMFNEIENIEAPLRESYRVLKRGGVLVFAVTHPVMDLWEYAREKFVETSKIIKNPRSYFDRGYDAFLLDTDSLGRKTRSSRVYEIEHYHRPIRDFFSALLGAGFQISGMEEPEINRPLLRRYPMFRAMREHPSSLVFKAQKF